MAKAPAPKRNQFHAEMSIRVNRKLYPNADEQDIMELVQRVLEGEQVDGIEVKRFEVRDEDETDTADTGEYGFASAFMRSARRTSEPSGKAKGKKSEKR